MIKKRSWNDVKFTRRTISYLIVFIWDNPFGSMFVFDKLSHWMVKVDLVEVRNVDHWILHCVEINVKAVIIDYRFLLGYSWKWLHNDYFWSWLSCSPLLFHPKWVSNSDALVPNVHLRMSDYWNLCNSNNFLSFHVLLWGASFLFVIDFYSLTFVWMVCIMSCNSRTIHYRWWRCLEQIRN